MANKLRILVDLNIAVDVVQGRQPFYTQSALVMDAVANQEVEGLLAAHSITNLFYIVSRLANRQTAVTTIADLLNSFRVATVDDQVIRTAQALSWKDFEDAVQMAAALNANLDYIVTRNPQDFETQPVPVLTPAAFLTLLPPPPTPSP
ncbi:MAG: PIN domain-containing protein [Chloroflexi bacterium]|nr:PIN domain-containing protein [Ardenticatenaceae bacterium]NOG33196.1 PIN domain-containing protein [Chloroflexota bacterium]GIK54992.1 MAG: twitching motility protein PilT [Chloroflexota bacterium]